MNARIRKAFRQAILEQCGLEVVPTLAVLLKVVRAYADSISRRSCELDTAAAAFVLAVAAHRLGHLVRGSMALKVTLEQLVTPSNPAMAQLLECCRQAPIVLADLDLNSAWNIELQRSAQAVARSLDRRALRQ